jgi:hypothetical protein
VRLIGVGMAAVAIVLDMTVVRATQGQKGPLVGGDAGQGPLDAIRLGQPSFSDDGM